MPAAAQQQILVDLLHLDVLAILLGLAVFAGLRLARPLDRWEARGNVYTAPYGWRELVIVLGFLVWLLSLVVPGAGIQAAADGTTSLNVIGLVLDSVFKTLLVVGLLAYLAVFRDIDLDELFGLSRLSGQRVLLWSFGLLLPVLAVLFFLTSWFNEHVLLPVWGEIEPQPVVEAFANGGGSLPLKIALVVSAVVVAPICEEVLFRGLLYGVFKRYGERFFAAVASSLLFGIIHLHATSVLPLFLLALGFCLAYEFTGSLKVPIVMHALFNAFNLAMMWMGRTQI